IARIRETRPWHFSTNGCAIVLSAELQQQARRRSLTPLIVRLGQSSQRSKEPSWGSVHMQKPSAALIAAVLLLPSTAVHAKPNPKTINYPAGNTYALVATALFGVNNGIAMHAVPYKSEPDAIVDLLSGRVQLLFGTSTTVSAHVKDGKLRALATTLPERSP